MPYVSVYSTHAGTNTCMIFIYIQADFCQYVKSLFFRPILESEMYCQHKMHTYGYVHTLSAAAYLLTDQQNFRNS